MDLSLLLERSAAFLLCFMLMVEELAPCSQVTTSSILLLCSLPRDVLIHHGKTWNDGKTEEDGKKVGKSDQPENPNMKSVVD